MSLAIIPGSFDPMTMGHLDIVRYAAEHYDEVVVAVMINPDKCYWFDTATRVEIARLSVADLPNVRVIEDSGMLIDLFDRLGADAVCKGWRNDTDYEYEMRMAEWNREHNPRFQTELIRATDDHAVLSSTEVRNKLELRSDISGLVHPRAVSLILKKYQEEKT
ncbi:MAG: pantetheine-phosphate adenylyltransferase [Clostridia bacterium]|nr:pantetheine-phosphate adenylyltransferase [Clostridia bacterium]